MKNAQLATASLLSAVLMASSLPAHATDSAISTRMMNGLGQIIATQGNNALREMREELVRNLSENLKPLLPIPQPSQHRKPAQPAADLTSYVQMHEQARSSQ